MSYPAQQNVVATRQAQQSQALKIDGADNWTPEQFKLITDVVAKGATPDELKLFLYRCKHMGLDPLKPGMVHFIKYGTGAGTIVVGIEGFRSIAARTGKVSGVERGVHRNEAGEVVAGWCKVYRSDWNHPAHEEVPFDEYYKPGRNKDGPWDKMPATMIKKVAEAAALRMAFPDDLGGVYTREEMDQAAPQNPVHPGNPADDGLQTYQGYLPKYGTFANCRIENADPERLRAEIEKYEADSKRLNRPVLAWQAEFIKNAEPLVAQHEMVIAASMREPGQD